MYHAPAVASSPADGGEQPLILLSGPVPIPVASRELCPATYRRRAVPLPVREHLAYPARPTIEGIGAEHRLALGHGRHFRAAGDRGWIDKGGQSHRQRFAHDERETFSQAREDQQVGRTVQLGQRPVRSIQFDSDIRE